MKVKYRLVLLVIIIGFSCNLSAQKKWTLRDCIDYARQENIQVKKSQISVQSADIDLKKAKAGLFPSLSASVSQGYNHSRQDANGYKYKGIFNGQYGINASWTVYDGKKNLNNIKQAGLQKEADELFMEQQQNDIEISITQTYLQLLYARESIKNNENIVASSEAQLKQTQDFLDAGSITRAEYAQVEAQYSSDKYNLVLAQNSYDSYLLQLKQLLEMDMEDELDVVFPQIGDEQIKVFIPSKYEVYQTALSIMPEIRGNKLGIDIAQVGKSTAKAGYLPTVSINGSLGTSNIWNGDVPAFSTQVNRNFNQYIGVSVSVPIFDNRTNKSNVQKANLQIQTAELDYIQAQKDLSKTIENLYQDAISGQSKYQAAKDKLKSSELSYTLVKEQYALGMRNTVELTTEQNNYANALQELLQAKYTALLSLKLLSFYQGKEITL
ncbi:TolC family protein [Dysgonomonas sp. 511]|nr:TolC family protein [Dysgonomonas sp. 511]